MGKLKIDALDPGAQAMQINIDIAHEISDLAGMIYSSIYYMCKINEANENKNVFFHGKYWTYNSIRAMQEKQYPWKTYSQVKQAVKQLVDAGYIEKMPAVSGIVRNNTNLYSIK